MREFLRSKVRDLTITRANPNYEGSITLGPDIMAGAEFLPYEKVQVLCAETGARIETYVIEGKINSQCEINGPAARLMNVGDTVMVLSYKNMILLHAETYEILKKLKG